MGMLIGRTLHFERTKLVSISPFGISLREYITTPIPTLLASEKQKKVVFSGSKCMQDFSLSLFNCGSWLYHCSNLASISSGSIELQNSLVIFIPCSLLRFIASLISSRHFNTKGLLNPMGSYAVTAIDLAKVLKLWRLAPLSSLYNLLWPPNENSFQQLFKTIPSALSSPATNSRASSNFSLSASID